MSNKLYYLIFRQSRDTPMVTLFVDSTPTKAYDVLKRAGFYVACGHEGQGPTRDSHPNEGWDTDTDAGEGQPSRAKS